MIVEHPILLSLVFLFSYPLYKYLWKVFFGDREGFQECLRFWVVPGWLLSSRGERLDEFWSEFRLVLYFLVCVLVVAAAYTGISKILF